MISSKTATGAHEVKRGRIFHKCYKNHLASALNQEAHDGAQWKLDAQDWVAATRTA